MKDWNEKGRHMNQSTIIILGQGWKKLISKKVIKN
jgi:hypothetical protein